MKRDSRLSGSMAGLVALVLLVAAASPAVQAQQRNIPIPASSASPGGVAAASAATIEDVRQTQSLIQNQVTPWRQFAGQRKCTGRVRMYTVAAAGETSGGGSFGGTSVAFGSVCMTIMSDGNFRTEVPEYRITDMMFMAMRSGFVIASDWLGRPTTLYTNVQPALIGNNDWTGERAYDWTLVVSTSPY